MEIIEDCSPYFIRFTYEGASKVLDLCRTLLRPNSQEPFLHYRYPSGIGWNILSKVPLARELNLNPSRVSLFITQPGTYYRAHKDGLHIKWGMNFNVSIRDEECVTSWYSDEDLAMYPIDNLPTKSSRECEGFEKRNHNPLKTMVAKEGECVLFNTDIFHDFDNRTSQHERVLLTLRDSGQRSFEEVRLMLWPAWRDSNSQPPAS